MQEYQELQKKKQEMQDQLEEYLEEAVAYLRYSTHNQDGGVSIEYQMKEIEEYAKRNGIKIVKWYIDKATTATKVAGRENFIQLFDDVKQGKTPPNLIIFATNRAFRNNFDSIQHRQILRDNGITLHSATQRIDEKTTAGRLNVNMLATIDQYKAEEISDFVAAATRYLISEGFFAGGIAPFGYKAKKVLHNGKERAKLFPEESEAEAVRYIFDSFTAGRPVTAICDSLKDKGIKKRNGEYFQPANITPILQNRIYIGERYYKMKSGLDAFSTNYCEPLITEEQFNTAQAIIERKKHKNKARKRKNVRALTGLVTCGECGRQFYGSLNNGKPYYKCAGRHRIGVKCKCAPINGEILEKAVLQAIKENLLTDEAIEKLAKEVLSQIKKAPAITEDKKQLLAQKNTLEIEIAELVQMKMSKEITESVYARMKGPKDAELDMVTRKLSQLGAAYNSTITKQSIKRQIKSIFDISQSYADFDKESLKDIFHQVVENVELSNTQMIIHLRIPFDKITFNEHDGFPKLALKVYIERPKRKRGQ